MPKSAKQVVITGAHSAIGQKLIGRLRHDELHIVGIISPWGKTAGLVIDEARINYIPHDLSMPLDGALLQACRDADCLVHLAWARPNSARKSTERNLRFYDNLKQAIDGDARQVFMSSVCATETNRSYYGQAKYAVAQAMESEQTIEIIAGLVTSSPPSGPYKALGDFVAKTRCRYTFLPSPISLISTEIKVIDALVEAVTALHIRRRIVPAYDPEPILLNALVKKILTDHGKMGLSVPVPSRPALFLLTAMRALLSGVPIIDRLITLLSVSPKDIEERVRTDWETQP